MSAQKIPDVPRTEWHPIETYPTEPGVPGVDDDEWGPEALLLVRCDSTTRSGWAVYVGHLEAGMWLVRDPDEPGAWMDLYRKPGYWQPIGEHPKDPFPHITQASSTRAE